MAQNVADDTRSVLFQLYVYADYGNVRKDVLWRRRNRWEDCSCCVVCIFSACRHAFISSFPFREKMKYGIDDLAANYFLKGDQITVFALHDNIIVGCGSICFMELMPTFSHPTGKRAHLMNVYTNGAYRRQGIASKMTTMLIEEAWNRGATEISLDATESGKPLYRKCGFKDSDECMVLGRKN